MPGDVDSPETILVVAPCGVVISILVLLRYEAEFCGGEKLVSGSVAIGNPRTYPFTCRLRTNVQHPLASYREGPMMLSRKNAGRRKDQDEILEGRPAVLTPTQDHSPTAFTRVNHICKKPIAYKIDGVPVQANGKSRQSEYQYRQAANRSGTNVDGRTSCGDGHWGQSTAADKCSATASRRT